LWRKQCLTESNCSTGETSFKRSTVSFNSALDRAIKTLKKHPEVSASMHDAGVFLDFSENPQKKGTRKGLQIFVKVCRYDEELLAKEPLSGGLLCEAVMAGAQQTNPVYETMTRWVDGRYTIRIWCDSPTFKMGPDENIQAALQRWNGVGVADMVRELCERFPRITAVEVLGYQQGGGIYYPDWK
jgi:hypothetical protein